MVEAKPLQQQEIPKENFSYDKDLWNKLDTIISQTRRGQNHLSGLDRFVRFYGQALRVFSGSLKKLAEGFERDMNKEQGIDTTTITVVNLKKALGDISEMIDKKAALITNDITEPLE